MDAIPEVYEETNVSQAVLNAVVKFASKDIEPPTSFNPSIYLFQVVSLKSVTSRLDGAGLKSGIVLIFGIVVYPVVGLVPAVVSTQYFNKIPAVLILMP